MIKSKKIICQCNYDKNKLISRHPIIAKLISKKTRILINNVNPSWIVNNKTKGLEENQIKAEGKFRVCFVGNFDSPRKGHQLLLDAANEILKKDTGIEFILIGGGTDGCLQVQFTTEIGSPLEILTAIQLQTTQREILLTMRSLEEILVNQFMSRHLLTREDRVAHFLKMCLCLWTVVIVG